jgi:hypothetical protein
MRSQVFNDELTALQLHYKEPHDSRGEGVLLTSAIISLPTERPTESTHVLGVVAKTAHPKPTCLGAATGRLSCANKKKKI